MESDQSVCMMASTSTDTSDKMDLKLMLKKEIACNGLAVIVTNDYNDSAKPLISTHKDGQEMISAFKQLNFATYWAQNVSKEELKSLISEITSVSREQCQGYICIAIIFSGHGGQEDTLGMQRGDNILLHNDIIDPLIGQQELADIPKLFFIDACRGSGAVNAVSKDCQATTFIPKRKFSLLGNYLLAYATIPLKTSFLSNSGSIWMQKLAQQLKKSTDSIQHIVSETTKILWDDYDRQDSILLQQPQTINTLNCGALYLRPESPFSPHNKTFRLYKLSDQDLPPSIPLVIPPGYEYDSQSHSMKKRTTNSSQAGFTLVDEAAQILKSIEKPVAVLAICGPYRSGKSFFLSRFLGKNQVFKVSHTTAACTRGIWLSTTALVCSDYILLLIDSEGTDAVGSGQTSESLSTAILTLTNLFSSYLIYNSKGVPQKGDLTKMSYFTQLSTNIIVQDATLHDNAERLHQHFPDFLWLLRDVSLSSEAESVTSYVKKEVLHCDRANSGSIETGHKLLTLYPDFECFSLPHPSCSSKETLDDSKLGHKFKESFCELSTDILDKIKIKKGHTMKPINGVALAYLAQQYVNAINTPDVIPNLDHCWKTAVVENLRGTVEHLLLTYIEEMDQQLSGRYPVEFDSTVDTSTSLMKEHHQVSRLKTNQLRKKAAELLAIKQDKLAENDLYNELEQKLHNRIAVFEQKTNKVIGGALLTFVDENCTASEKTCKDLFSSLCPLYTPLKKEEIKKKYYDEAVGPEKDNVFNESFEAIPDPPGNVKVSKVTSFHARVSWEKPMTPKQLEYHVITQTCNENSESAAEETAKCYFDLDNLTPATEYQVIVHAVNGRLYGESTQTVFKSKPAPPKQPHIQRILPSKESLSKIVIVLEKRDHFAVKLVFQYEHLKFRTLIDLIHNPECLKRCIFTLEGPFSVLKIAF